MDPTDASTVAPAPAAIVPAAAVPAPAPLQNFFSDWVASGQAAMAASPTYFQRWDSIKTGLLVLALGGVAYLLMSEDDGGSNEPVEP